jgi:hypothetical protein
MTEDASAAEREVKYSEIPKVEWWDCTVGFYCFCGGEITLSDEEPKECSCGRTWRLDTRLFMKEARS